MSSNSSSYVRRRLGAFSRRLYNLSRDAMEVHEGCTPLEERLYGEILQLITDGAMAMYFNALEAIRNGKR